MSDGTDDATHDRVAEPDPVPAESDPIESGLGWPAIPTDAALAQGLAQASERERLRLIDHIRGLEAELRDLRSRLPDGDRADLLDQVRQMQEQHRLQRQQHIWDLQEAAEETRSAMQAAVTWRVGRRVTAPLRWLQRD